MLSFHVVNKKRVKEGASNSGPRFINFLSKDIGQPMRPNVMA